jgi:hypothetical protein
MSPPAEMAQPPLTTSCVTVSPRRLERRLSAGRVWITVALLTGLAGVFTAVGADARWLAALGGVVIAHGAVPSGIPFMAAAGHGWPNPLVLAELIFHTLESGFGDRGIALAQLFAVGLALWLLARDARSSGAPAAGTCGALALVALGAFPSLAIARVQMFSLVLFPALIWLLRAESRNPSRRLWVAVPLIALWSNLHGAVLLGLAVLGGYLLLGRLRAQPVTAIGVGLASAAAVCATPAGIHTVAYLHGLTTNLAAARGAGQWAPLGQSPFDVVALTAGALLLLKARGRRPAVWELAVFVGLVALTVGAARDEVWLLFFLASPAARGRLLLGRDLSRALPAGAALATVLLALALGRAPAPAGASAPLVREAVALAQGTPVLADGIPAEQVALEGGRILAGNPLDALPRAEQASYLDWLAGHRSGRRELRDTRVRVVLVSRGSAADGLVRADPAFTRRGGDATANLYVRR